jgi:polysaccharide biosynthesis protein PelA
MRVAALALVVFLLAVASSSAEVRTFALALGARQPVERLARFDLVVVDGEDTPRRDIRALRRRGVVVLGYLSVGTIERGRGWFRRARPYRLELWQDWGEWYADVSATRYRRLIARQVAPALLRKGFSGLFLDNTDMVEGHRRQRAGMRGLVRSLSRLVHRRGGLLFTQNGEDSIGSTLRFYDGWNREDVSYGYDFTRRRYRRTPAADRRAAQAALRRISAAGLLVTSTDYAASGDTAAAGDAVATACSAGALPFVSDIALRRLPDPVRCP